MTTVPEARAQAQAIPLPEGFQLNVFELGPNNSGITGLAIQMEASLDDRTVGQMLVIPYEMLDEENIPDRVRLLALDLELLLDDPPPVGEVQIKHVGEGSES